MQCGSSGSQLRKLIVWQVKEDPKSWRLGSGMLCATLDLQPTIGVKKCCKRAKTASQTPSRPCYCSISLDLSTAAGHRICVPRIQIIAWHFDVELVCKFVMYSYRFVSSLMTMRTHLTQLKSAHFCFHPITHVLVRQLGSSEHQYFALS